MHTFLSSWRSMVNSLLSKSNSEVSWILSLAPSVFSDLRAWVRAAEGRMTKVMLSLEIDPNTYKKFSSECSLVKTLRHSSQEMENNEKERVNVESLLWGSLCPFIYSRGIRVVYVSELWLLSRFGMQIDSEKSFSFARDSIMEESFFIWTFSI